MIKVNGLKVIGLDERVIGKVVEMSASEAKFKIVEYYINEYENYMNRTIDTFTIEPQNSLSAKAYLKAFKEELSKHTRLKDVFVEDTVMEFLMNDD